MSSGNGHDPSTKQMVEILLRLESRMEAGFQELHGDVQALREDMGALRADVTGIKNELRSLRPELRGDLESMQERIARLEATAPKTAAE